MASAWKFRIGECVASSLGRRGQLSQLAYRLDVRVSHPTRMACAAEGQRMCADTPTSGALHWCQAVSQSGLCELSQRPSRQVPTGEAPGCQMPGKLTCDSRLREAADAASQRQLTAPLAQKLAQCLSRPPDAERKPGNHITAGMGILGTRNAPGKCRTTDANCEETHARISLCAPPRR